MTKRPDLRRRPRAAGPKAYGAEGFTLIEVVITLGILMALTIAVASMLRSGFDVKQGLSERARVVHRLATALTKVSDDIQHAHYVSAKDVVRNGIDRNMKTIFKLDKTGGEDKLALTTRTHRPMRSGTYESEFTYVVYELKDSKDQPGRKDLYRAETPVIPLDLKEPPPERLFERNIKSMNIEYWKGGDWSKNDYWDTGRGDTRNLIPTLVRITIESWVHDRHEGEGDETLDLATEKMGTAVYLLQAQEYQAITAEKDSKTIRWDHL